MPFLFLRILVQLNLTRTAFVQYFDECISAVLTFSTNGNKRFSILPHSTRAGNASL
jgi:hypothetical protein